MSRTSLRALAEQPRRHTAVVAWCYVLGSLVTGLSAVPALTGWTSEPELAVGTWVLSGAGLVTGLVALGRRRLRPRVLDAMVVLAAVVVAVAVLLAPDRETALVLAGACTLTSIDCAFTGGRRVGVIRAAVLLVPVIAALTWQGVAITAAAALVCLQLGVVLMVGHMLRQAPQRAVDLLTGMPDRRAFDAALEVAVRRAVRHQTPLSVVLLDVDGFGALNEADGHENGDRVLVRLAAGLDAALRAEPRHGRGALLARLGGDDFAVVVPDCDHAAAQELAQRLVAAAAPLSLCAGTALREAGEEAAPLQRRAAAALSRAKSMGRGLVEHSPATDRELVRDLVDAIASDRLQVVLQPVVDPADGQLMGVEALARWHHPRRGAIPPDVFVHLAETHGLVVEMGRALLRRAIAEATSLRDAVGRDLLLTVNASGLELVHPDFVPQVVEVLAATRWSPRHLVVEVTESLVEADSPEAREALEDLRWCGIGVAIDDFGTGYSSLSRMDQLPADYLKLDSGFIAEISESPRRRALLRGLVAMSREIGLVVIAEGIETSDQALLVSEVGCPLAQGFHFHRPAPAADLARRFQAPAPAPAPDTARAGAGTGTA